MNQTAKARIQQKGDFAENWEQHSQFIPEKNEIITYQYKDGTSRPRIKLGDGVTPVGNLPFITEAYSLEEAPLITTADIDAICAEDILIVDAEGETF